MGFKVLKGLFFQAIEGVFGGRYGGFFNEK
jgi:hypothetical protein